MIAATPGCNNDENGISLLDVNMSTKFCFRGNAGFIIWEAPETLQVESYTLTTGFDTSTYSGRNPKSWILYGADTELSKDSKEWEIIDSVTDDKKMKAKNYRDYTFKLKSHAKAYKYYKFEILDNKGDECTQLAELDLKGNIVK